MNSKMLFIIIFNCLYGVFGDTTTTNAKKLTGGRSRASIMRVVTKNLPQLKKAYNNRLRHKRKIFGKITIKYAIDEFGKIIFIKTEKNTTKDTTLENNVKSIISKWEFGKINKPGDVTEVVYPFVFSTDQPKRSLEILDMTFELDQDKVGARSTKKIGRILYKNKHQLLNFLCSSDYYDNKICYYSGLYVVFS